MPAVNQKLLDQVIRFQIDLRRLEAGTQRKVVKSLEKLQKALIGEIASGNLRGMTKAQTKKLLSSLSPILAQYYTEARNTLQDELDGVADVQVAQAQKSLNATVFTERVPLLPTSHVIERVSRNVLINGGPLDSWWKKQEGDTMFKVSAQIREGILLGEANQGIISRIIGKRGVPGVMDISRRNAATLVQTATHTVANEARQAVYNENADVIKSLIWFTAMDSHVCVLCIGRSGKRWKNNQAKTPISHSIAFQIPPIHMNDRCVLLPETATFKELGVDLPEPTIGDRASSLGPISAKTTFNDYLRQVPVSQQNEMLGVGRAKLWREKKISLSQLLDGKGRELNLEQVRQRHI